VSDASDEEVSVFVDRDALGIKVDTGERETLTRKRRARQARVAGLTLLAGFTWLARISGLARFAGFTRLARISVFTGFSARSRVALLALWPLGSFRSRRPNLAVLAATYG
jgi:hypothetical protein